MCIFKYDRYDWKTVSRTFAQCLSKDESEMVFHLRSVEVCALQTKNAKASLACSITFEFVPKLTNSSPFYRIVTFQVGFAIIGKYFHSGCKTEIGLMCPICFLCMVCPQKYDCSTSSCAGLEFRRGEMRCEMWHEEISAHRHVFHNRTVPGSFWWVVFVFSTCKAASTVFKLDQ